MKRYILLEVLKRLKGSSPLKKKHKVLIGLGLASLVLTGALVLWIGISSIRYVSNLAQAANVTSSIETLKSEFQEVPALTAGCWEMAQSLLSVEPWAQRPISDNFEDLKVACLKTKDPTCEGAECEGETI